MSGTDFSGILTGAQFLAGTLPLRQAQTAKTWAEIPLTQAQTEETRARVPLTQAQTADTWANVPYRGALTTKTQLENQMNQLFLDQAQQGIRGSQGSGYDSGYQLPPDEGSAAQPSSGGRGSGGRGIGPAPTDAPGTKGSDVLAFAAPHSPQTPASTMLARVSQPQPDPYSDGPIMIGATTAEPVPPSQMPPAPQQPAPAVVAQNLPPQPAVGSAQLQQQTPPNMRTSPAGVYFPPLGKVVPRDLVTNYWMDVLKTHDMSGALARLDGQRSARILQLAESADNPETWRRNTEFALRQGLISEQEYAHIHNNFGLRQTVIRGHQTHEQNALQDADMRREGKTWNGQQYVFDPTLHAGEAPQETGGSFVNGVWVPRLTTSTERARESGSPTMPPGGVSGPGGGGPAAPAPAPGPGSQAPSGSTTFDKYANSLLGHENPAGDPTLRNPTSGASGMFQWMPSRNGVPGTKVEVARKYLPEITRGMTNDQIDAHNFTPEQEHQMLRGFTADNAAKLQQMGQRPSEAALFLAHYLGAGGVANLRKYPTNTVLADIPEFRGAVAANPELQGGTTVGGLVREAQRRFGNNTLTADDINGRVKVAGPGAGSTPGSTTPPPPAPGDRFQGRPSLPPGVPEINVHNINTDNKAVDEANSAAIAAQGQQRVAQDMLDRTPRLEAAGAFGPGSEFRTRALAFIHTAIQNSTGKSDLLKKFDEWGNFENQSDRESFIKEAIQLSLAQEASMPGVRPGIGLSVMVGKGTPNLDMQGDTVRELLTRMVVGHLMTQDYAAGLNDAVGAKQASVDLNTQRYDPVQREYDKDWIGPKGLHNANVYLGAASLLYDGGKSDEWKKRLSPEQQRSAVELAMRVDPNWAPPGYRRK